MPYYSPINTAKQREIAMWFHEDDSAGFADPIVDAIYALIVAVIAALIGVIAWSLYVWGVV